MKNAIAIVGMCGSGKSVLASYFIDKGYDCIYFGSVTMEKLKEQNLEINEQNERMMREALRKEYGMGAFAHILLPRILDKLKTNNVVLDGLYSWEEFELLKEKLGDNLIVIAIVADKDIRYQRLSIREFRPLTKEEAIKRDLSEIKNLNKASPIAYADYFILNNGSIDDYYKRIDEILESIEVV